VSLDLTQGQLLSNDKSSNKNSVIEYSLVLGLNSFLEDGSSDATLAKLLNVSLYK